jgi:hypothetical protein
LYRSKAHGEEGSMFTVETVAALGLSVGTRRPNVIRVLLDCFQSSTDTAVFGDTAPFRRNVSPGHVLPFTYRLHGATSQKMAVIV